MSNETIDDTKLRPNYNIDTTKYKGKYPVVELEKVRKQLLHEIYEESCIFLDELSVKRKCGLFTNEVLEYYLHDKQPKNFKENFEIDKEDLITENEIMNSELNTAQQTTGPEASTPVKISPIEPPKPSETIKLDYVIPSEPAKLDPQALNAQTKMLCRLLNLVHGCEVEKFKFCPSHIQGTDTCNSNMTSIFVCDNCQMANIQRENMVKHLNETKHLSASEYFIDRTPNENIYQPNSRIKYIKSRASLVNTSSLSDVAVFCPKCFFCFGKSITAGALHYRYDHSIDEYVYSLSELKRTEKLTIEKIHSCFECKMKFKKLTDLCTHLGNANHFPKNQNQEICVLVCPFDKCYYKSIHFFSFKTHLLTHPYFQRPATESSDLSVSVVMYVYVKPTALYHVSSFGDTSMENMDELKCIEALLENIKGHNDCAETVKKIRFRKDFLHKTLPSCNKIQA